MLEEGRSVVNGRDASLAVTGNHQGLYKQPYQKNLTSEDAEYEGYTQLFKGFFEKFTRWGDILSAKGYHEGIGRGGFSVFRSGNGHIIQPGTTLIKDDPSDKI